MKKQIVFIIIILTTVVVFSGCQKKSNSVVNQPENNTVVEDPNEVATTTEEIDTSDWQTYRNEEYGFEVMYPKEWLVEKNNGVQIYTKKFRNGYPEGGGGVFISLTNDNLMQFVDKYNSSDVSNGLSLARIINQKKIDFCDTEATMLTGSTAVGVDNNFIYFSVNEKSYLLSYHEFDDVHKGIISSFKLIK